MSGVAAARATTCRLPDDQRRLARAGHRGVEHLAAQEVRAGGGVGDDDRDGELDALALVDRAGVGELELWRLVFGEVEDRSVGLDDEGLGVLVVLEEAEDGAVHEAEVVEVAAGEHELVSDAEAAAEDLAAGRVERLAEAGVQGVDAQGSAVDRGEDLDVGDRVDAEVLREALGDERDDLVEGGSGVGALDHEEVAGHLVRRGEGRCARRCGRRGLRGRSCFRPPGGRCG